MAGKNRLKKFDLGEHVTKGLAVHSIASNTTHAINIQPSEGNNDDNNNNNHTNSERTHLLEGASNLYKKPYPKYSGWIWETDLFHIPDTVDGLVAALEELERYNFLLGKRITRTDLATSYSQSIIGFFLAGIAQGTKQLLNEKDKSSEKLDFILDIITVALPLVTGIITKINKDIRDSAISYTDDIQKSAKILQENLQRLRLP